ncbi:MAG: methyltransferase domain-containing protein [Actinomycetota bacterium]|nr:methyltransferase domain-containing protein [Actinomycetota bacterium]
MSSSLWAAGRYDAVGERIAPIAEQLLDAVARRRPLRGADLVDLACGTGNAALAAAARGAHVTAVDLTAELIGIAQGRDSDGAVTWRCADAADTGLPEGGFDAAVSNMGVIFVDPPRQVAELARLLKPQGVLSFSAWIRQEANPLFDPVVAVLGPPAASTFSPDQWGDADVVTDRLAPHFTDLEFERGLHRWEFASMAAALRFLHDESPVHVETFRRASEQREALTAAFEAALQPHLDAAGTVSFASPYVVVSATRRA